MKTLELIRDRRLQIPMSVSWYLSGIGHAQGLQELFTRQSPQKLKVMREHAIAQSTVSSNRIEGVEIDQARIGTVVFGHPALKDRDEEDVAGYRDALNLIHTQGPALPVTEATILQLHKLSRGNVWDAGQYKDKPVDIIERLPGGGERLRFRSVSPAKTPEFTRALRGNMTLGPTLATCCLSSRRRATSSRNAPGRLRRRKGKRPNWFHGLSGNNTANFAW